MFICTSICVCAGGAEYRSPTSPPVLPQSYACVLRTALPIPVTPDQDHDGVDTLTRYRYPYRTYLIGTVTVYLSTLLINHGNFAVRKKLDCRLESKLLGTGTVQGSFGSNPTGCRIKLSMVSPVQSGNWKKLNTLTGIFRVLLVREKNLLKIFFLRELFFACCMRFQGSIFTIVKSSKQSRGQLLPVITKLFSVLMLLSRKIYYFGHQVFRAVCSIANPK